MKKRKILLSFLVIFVLAISGKAFSLPEDVRLVSANGYDTVLEMTLPDFQLETVKVSGEAFVRIRMKNHPFTAEPGKPELPFISTLLEVPPKGMPEIKILENDFETRKVKRIYPVARLVTEGKKTMERRFYADSGVYGSSGFYPGKQAKIGGKKIFRKTPVMRLKIYPFQWNPHSGELRYSKRMRIRVFFPNAGKDLPGEEGVVQTDHASGVFEKMKKDIIINRSRLSHTSGMVSGNDREKKGKSRKKKQAFPEPERCFLFSVNKVGIYRVYYEDLLNNSPVGVDISGVDTDTFRLMNAEREIGIKVVTNSPDTGFGKGDYIKFFARGLDNRYTDVNIYRLYWGGVSGKRMESFDGAPSGTAVVQNTFHDMLHFEKNKHIQQEIPGVLEKDYFFWDSAISAPGSKEYEIDIPNPVGSPDRISGRVYLQGQSGLEHHVIVLLNGTRIGEAEWNGRVENIQTLEMISPYNYFQEGINSLVLELPGDTGAPLDLVFFNWLKIGYERMMNAVDDELEFSVRGDGLFQMEVSGLTGADILIYDITDAKDPKEIRNFQVIPEQGLYKAVFDDSVNVSKSYYICSAERIKQPDTIVYQVSAGLKNPENGADYIIITDESFREATEPLRQFREKSGMRAMTVSMQDIYFEFSHGIFDPASIRDFLSYAYHNWKPPSPSYVFLIGDANIDYRNYLQTDMKNIVPVHHSETYPFGLTGDDGWYACVDGDDALPDMMIGRAPAGKVESVFVLVNKIITHENEPVTYSTKNLFISDNDERSFQLLNDAMSVIPPSEYDIQRVSLNEYSDRDAASNDVVAGINEGRLVTNYVGHGSARQWAGEPVFENSDVLRLENGHPLTFALSMNCLSGYFSHPSKYSLAETFVIAENRGAIAMYAPSGGAYVWQLQLLDHGLFSLMFKRFLNPVGAIVTYAEISAFAAGLNDDGLEMFNLFGDPASRLHYIEKPGDFDGNGNVELNDALMVLRILANAPGTSAEIDVAAGIGGKPGIRDVLYILQSVK